MSKIPIMFELMRQRNITAKQLSEATGISAGNISDWKSGRSKPSMEKLAILADYFHVSTDFLVGVKSGQQMDDNLRMVVVDDELDELVTALQSVPELRQILMRIKGCNVQTLRKIDRIAQAFVDEQEK